MSVGSWLAEECWELPVTFDLLAQGDAKPDDRCRQYAQTRFVGVRGGSTLTLSLQDHGVATKLRCTWDDGFRLDVTWRKLWWPWPTDNLTLGATAFARHYALIVTNMMKYAPTIRHECTHAKQFHNLGWWWTLTHPNAREAGAHWAETSNFPTLTVIR